MSGVYIHVPFCWQRCHYCDFYSTLNLDKRKDFCDKLIMEIKLRKDFISDQNIDTVYFGGGTPSLLNPADIKRIIDEVRSSFYLSDNSEISLEANPDDLSAEYFEKILDAGINRLSIGIQSFDDKDLRMLNRRHDSARAVESVKEAYQSGFSNISIDLIYGLPGQDLKSWTTDLEKALELNPEHISAYHLTYEKGTMFYKWMKEGKIIEVKEDTSYEMFEKATDILEGNSYEHYEISNYARDGKYSRHNLKYWFGAQYLGAGPSAHSYNGSIRQWNIPDLDKWLSAHIEGDDFTQTEEIDCETARNEMIMTRLRTRWGVAEKEYTDKFGTLSWNILLKCSNKYLEKGLMQIKDGALSITRKAKFLSDGIIADLFILPTP